MSWWTAPAALCSLGAAAGAVIGAAALVWARRRLVVIDVDGPSMEPTYRTGDQVLVRRAGLGELRTGDVVVVERPHGPGRWPDPPVRRLRSRTWMIKRVAALPGDPVPDGVPVDAVAPGHLAVLGDNRDASYDSRVAGLFPAERLLGVVVRQLTNRS